MKKSVVFNLKPDENNQFKADMYHDKNIVKQANLSKDEFRNVSSIEDVEFKGAKET